MNQSKYDPKLDPKYPSTQQAKDAAKKADATNVQATVVGQPQVALGVTKIHEELPVSKKALDTKARILDSATLAVNTQAVKTAATGSEAALLAGREGVKLNHKGAFVAVKASASDTASNNAMVSEGGNIQAGDAKHTVREPSAPTGGLPSLPAAHGNGADREKTAAASTDTVH
jgi:hypothetical protein